GLGARQVLAHHPARRQPDGVLVVDHLGGWSVTHGVEARPAGLGREPTALEQAPGPGVVLARAGPEHAHLAFDALPGDAEVVGAPALRGDPQLLEDLLGVPVGEVVALAEAGGEVAQDLPVETGL